MNNTADIVNLDERRPVVKADIDNGYDRLAHDITDTLAKNPAKLSGCEYQVIFALVGKTFRFHKKNDWVAGSQICEATGMSKNHVSKTVKSLEAKNVVKRTGKVIGINPVISEWEVNQSVNKSTPIRQPEKLTNQCTKVNQSVSEVNQSVNKSTPITPPQKKTTKTKEINTKEKREKPRYSIPDELPDESIENFIQDRKARKQPMTEQAIKIFVTKCLQAQMEGYDVTQLIEESIVNGWKSIFPKPQFRTGASRKKIPHGGFGTQDYGEDTATFDEVTQ